MKNKPIKALITALALLLIFIYGCAKGEAPDTAEGLMPADGNLGMSPGVSGAAEQPDSGAVDSGEYYYSATYLSLENPLSRCLYKIIGDILFCYGETEFFWCDTSGQLLSGYGTIETGDMQITGWTADSERVYISYADLTKEYPEDSAPIWTYENQMVRIYALSGELESEIPLPDLPDYSCYNSLAVNNGIIYLMGDNHAFRYADGKLTQKDILTALPQDAYKSRASIFSFLTTNGGQLLVVLQLDYENYLYSLDFEAGTLEGPIVENYPNDFTLYHEGSMYGYDVYITCSSSDELRGYNYGDEKAELIFEYSECGSTFLGLNPSDPVCVGEDKWLFSAFTMGNFFTAMVEQLPGARPESNKTEITIGGVYSSLDGIYLPSQITLFNVMSAEYELVFVDYSDEYPYNVSTGWSDAITAMNLDILSGNASDIILLKDLEWKSFGAKGILADIYQLIDSDAQLSRGDFFENILAGGEIDGKLYYLPTAFTFSGIVGPAELLEDISGWTLSEFLALEDSLAEGVDLIKPGTFNELKSWYLETGYTAWIDGNTCSFDDGSFAEMLEYIKADVPDESIDSSVARLNGKIALASNTVSLFMDLSIESILNGGEARYTGYPTPNRMGVTASLGTGIGINAASENIDAAWDFVRQILSKEFMSSYISRLSIRKSLLIDDIEAGTSEDSFINSTVEFSEGTTISLVPITRWQADYYIDLVTSIECVETDSNIAQILYEDTAAFFSGQKSADEVASIIQNRVSIYLAERS